MKDSRENLEKKDKGTSLDNKNDQRDPRNQGKSGHKSEDSDVMEKEDQDKTKGEVTKKHEETNKNKKVDQGKDEKTIREEGKLREPQRKEEEVEEAYSTKGEKSDTKKNKTHESETSNR